MEVHRLSPHISKVGTPVNNEPVGLVVGFIPESGAWLLVLTQGDAAHQLHPVSFMHTISWHLPDFLGIWPKAS